MFHAHRTERDEEDLIELQIDHVIEFGFQPHQGGGAEAAQKDRVLSAEAEVFAGLGDFSEALGVGDIVGNDPGFHSSSTCSRFLCGVSAPSMVSPPLPDE